MKVIEKLEEESGMKRIARRIEFNELAKCLNINI